MGMIRKRKSSAYTLIFEPEDESEEEEDALIDSPAALASPTPQIDSLLAAILIDTEAPPPEI